MWINLWINGPKIVFYFVVFSIVTTLISIVIKYFQGPQLTITYNCREADVIEFPIEVRHRCKELILRRKNN